MRSDPQSADARDLAGDLALAGACAVALAGVLYLAFASAPVPDARDEPAIGQVALLYNDVRLRAEGQLAWGEVRTGAPVRDGDALYAAPGSSARIALDDGAEIELDASSLMVIRRTPEALDEPVRIELVRGAARGVAGAGSLHIVTGGSEVAVSERGDVRIRQSGGAAAVEVSRGRATLSAGSERIALREGQRADALPGKARVSELKVRLSEPADGSVIYFGGRATAVRFAWSAPDAAAPCTLEVSPAGDFSGEVQRVESSSPASQGLPAGIYHWRVRCRGPGGGARSPERTFALVEDLPPVSLAPSEGQVVDLSRSRELAFEWSELPGETAYRLELAPDGAFEAPSKSLRARRASARIRFDLPEGRYCYRVRGEGPVHPSAPWSAPTCFRVVTRPVLGAPKVFEPRREPVPAPPEGKGAWLLDLLVPSAHAAEPPRSALVLRWEQIPGAKAYLLEIAEDRAFQRVVVRERLALPVFRWEIVARRDYYWRVRGIDELGREGSLSELVRIGSEVSPPALSSPAAGARVELEPGAGIAFAWKGSPVLASYRLELAANREFGAPIAQLGRREPRASWSPARAGTIYWRVVGIDLNGQSTEPSEVRAVTAVPSAPDPRGPGDEEKIFAEAAPQKVGIRWSARPVARYEVELEAAKGSRRISTAAPELAVEVARPGRVRWRVRGVDPETAWSRRRAFEVAVRAPAPKVPADGAELPPGSAPTLEWEAVPLAEAYELELAAGSAPPRLVRTAEPAWPAPALAPGQYRWRVRALAPGASPGSEMSPPFGFRIQAVPPMVEVGSPAVAGGASVAPERIAVPIPAVSPFVANRPAHGVSVAAFAGVASNFGALTSLATGFEVGWRPSHRRVHFGVAVRASEYAAAQSFGKGAGQVRSELWALPIEAVGLVAVPVQRLELVVSAGPLARVVVGTVGLRDGTRLRRGSIELGAVARGALELPLGPGRAWGELGTAVSVPTRGLISTSAGVVTVGAGYRLEVW